VLPGAELPLPRALVDVVVGGVVVTGRVERLRPTGLVVELPGALPPGDGVELYWNGADGVRVVPARVVLCWTVRTGVRVQLVPSGPAEAGNRRDAVRADLRLRAQLTERESGAVFLGRTRDVSETGLRCLLAPGPLAPTAGAEVDVGLPLRGAVFPVPGRLHRVSPDEDGWDVVVAYAGLCASMADLLRAQVFAALREQRRLSLR